ncbi:hypothetical protein Y1Q_0006292 [Alligator mississippiensis]|uniref:Uncharacterized protein n=1 Tax=Alligator mississippiensis TaxID=8496 RepID=A0A151NXW6_ALLMI|nr:hypothetical protein Y1Q_0006292 [Alligator mississippiensis]
MSLKRARNSFDEDVMVLQLDMGDGPHLAVRMRPQGCCHPQLGYCRCTGSAREDVTYENAWNRLKEAWDQQELELDRGDRKFWAELLTLEHEHLWVLQEKNIILGWAGLPDGDDRVLGTVLASVVVFILPAAQSLSLELHTP